MLDESAGWLNGSSGEALLQEAFAHSAEFALGNLSEKLKSRPILCIGGTLDIYTQPQMHREPFAQTIQRAGGTAFQTIDFPFRDKKDVRLCWRTSFLMRSTDHIT